MYMDEQLSVAAKRSNYQQYQPNQSEEEEQEEREVAPEDREFLIYASFITEALKFWNFSFFKRLRLLITLLDKQLQKHGDQKNKTSEMIQTEMLTANLSWFVQLLKTICPPPVKVINGIALNVETDDLQLEIYKNL